MQVNPGSGIREIFLEESVILSFGIRNPAQGIRDPANFWNPESNTWNSRIRSMEFIIQDFLGLSYMGRYILLDYVSLPYQLKT